LKYYETGRGLYLILASISAALMFATKETWLMNGPVLLIACISTAIYFRRESLDREADQAPLADRWRETIDRLGGNSATHHCPHGVCRVHRGRRFVLFIIL
jgi:hypothetical protein